MGSDRSEICAGVYVNVIWEPACGPGAIVKVLRETKRTVIASDLVDYGCPLSYSKHDFLMEQKAPFNCQCIVTNPPFKLANQFVAHALALVPKVVMLLRLAFMESETRTPILDNGHLARVYVFRKRLPMMHRAGWEGRKANSGMAFAWFVWERGHNSASAELRRISWTPIQEKVAA
jgi:hypothetical protein